MWDQDVYVNGDLVSSISTSTSIFIQPRETSICANIPQAKASTARSSTFPWSVPQAPVPLPLPTVCVRYATLSPQFPVADSQSQAGKTYQSRSVVQTRASARPVAAGIKAPLVARCRPAMMERLGSSPRSRCLILMSLLRRKRVSGKALRHDLW